MARPPSSGRSGLNLALVASCFFATGAAGLIYEIIWNKMLALMMGNTSYSLAALLTVFMGGLALGAYLGGRWAPAGWGALRTYGLLELGVGGYCFVLPFLIRASEPLFSAIYQKHYQSLLTFNLMQFALVGGLLLVPTTFMGATLPILTSFVVSRATVIARSVGVLYAVNSGGAFVGAILAGLYLLPTIGQQNSYRIAVAVNAVVGAIALLIAAVGTRRGLQATEKPARSNLQKKAGRRNEPGLEPESKGALIEGRFPRSVLLTGFGVAGFCAMVYQVAWTRMVTLSVGSSTYAFTLIAGSFILGLTAGSVMLGWIGDRPNGKYAAGLLPMLIGLAAIVTVWQLGELPIRVTHLLGEIHEFRKLEWAKFWMIFGTFLPATFCMGALLPIVCRYASRGVDDAARAVGSAYAANAIGTIVGSFCGGFVLIPLAGMRSSILIGGCLNLLVGLLFMYYILGSKQVGWTLLTLMLLVGSSVAAVAAPSWDQSVITSGPFNNLDVYLRGNQRASDETIRQRMERKIIYLREGVSALAAVTETSSGNRELIVNGVRDAASRGVMQNWLANVPMLMARDTRRVLVIGLGSGHTLGSVEIHPGVEQIDCVEISPEVVEAARKYFEEFTGHALADSRVRLLVADGRLHMTHTDRKYDVIVSQPSHPWIAGASAMFTRECFELMKERLEPDGLACIWAQGFSIPVDTFRTLCGTWASVWEHSSAWSSRTMSSYLFLGSRRRLDIDFATLSQRMAVPRVREQLEWMQIASPAEFMTYLVTANEKLAAVGEGLAINTDDNSRIEFDTPRGMFADREKGVTAMLHRFRVDPWQFVTGLEADAEYVKQRIKAREIVSLQAKAVESLDRPIEERRAILTDVIQKYPAEAISQQELGRLGKPSARRMSAPPQHGR